MALASVTANGRGATDRLLTNVTERLAQDGVRMVGALRAPSPSGGNGQCDSDLRLLPDGMMVRITQDLGAGSGACRLDAGALEDAVGLVTARLTAEGADLVVLNKFGLSEAEGRGFRALIAEALGRDVPVLIGVSDAHRAAFEGFAQGMATVLLPDEDVIIAWYRAATGHDARTTEEE